MTTAGLITGNDDIIEPDVLNKDIPKLGGDGGAIALAADGSMAMPFNTDGMFRAWVGADGVAHVAIYADEGDLAD